MGRRSSIIRLLSLLLTVPVLGLLAGGAREAADALQGVRTADNVVAVAEVDRGLLQALIALRSLGGPVQTALQVETDPRPQIAAARAEIDTTVRPAQVRLAALGLPEATQIGPELTSTLAQVDQSFALVDAEAAKPIPSRRLEAVQPNLEAGHTAGAAFERASTAIGNRVRMSGSDAADLVELRIQAWALRSAYGLQCSLLRPLVARGARLDAKTAQELGRLRGASGAAADRLTALAASPAALPGPAAQAIAAVAAVKKANGAIDQVIGRLDDSGKPLLSAVDWTHTCDTPFNVVVSVATLALDEEVAIAHAAQAGATRRLVLAGVIGGVAIMLALIAAGLVRRRLAVPLRRLGSSIARLSSGDYETGVTLPRHRDELHALAAALETLRQHTNEARALADQRERERERAAAEKTSALEAAAHEMTDRIGDVSGEAERTGRHAIAVLQHTTALRESISLLRQSVIRVVRTATPEVDRRQAPRFAIDRPGRLMVPGLGRRDSRVIDLSTGGASLSGCPALPPGSTGTLELDGVGFPLPFRVLDHDNGTLRVAFALDPASEAAFSTVPARLGRPMAA